MPADTVAGSGPTSGPAAILPQLAWSMQARSAPTSKTASAGPPPQAA